LFTTIINKLLEPTVKGKHIARIGVTYLEVYVRLLAVLVLILNGIHTYEDVINLLIVICLLLLVVSLFIGIYGAITLRNKVEPLHLKYIHQTIFSSIMYLGIFYVFKIWQ
jgi:hypothetical protein